MIKKSTNETKNETSFNMSQKLNIVNKHIPKNENITNKRIPKIEHHTFEIFFFIILHGPALRYGKHWVIFGKQTVYWASYKTPEGLWRLPLYILYCSPGPASILILKSWNLKYSPRAINWPISNTNLFMNCGDYLHQSRSKSSVGYAPRTKQGIKIGEERLHLQRQLSFLMHRRCVRCFAPGAKWSCCCADLH